MFELDSSKTSGKPALGEQRATVAVSAPSGAEKANGNKNRSETITREMVLARFIRLCSSALASPLAKESSAVIVNRISEITHVDRAVLVKLDGKQAIAAVTGGGAAAQDSPFADAVEYVRQAHGKRLDPLVVPQATGGPSGPAGRLREIQESMGGTSVLWLPLWLNRDAKVPAEYGLWLERWRGVSWNGADIELLRHAALFLGHAMARPRHTMARPKKRLVRTMAVLTAVVIFALPVTSTVTSPARVVPDRPRHVFAPMDGILKDLHVMPGDMVKKNDILFRYDSRVLDKRLEEARRNVSVAKAKMIRLQGAAHRDPQARSELPVQKIEVERAEADVDFYAKQLARAEVRTAEPGVIVLDDPDSLVGAALQTGQAVMSVADPSRTKLRIMVPESDVGYLEKGAKVKIRLDNDPFRNLPAIITRIGFEIRIPENQVPSVLAEATWVENSPSAQPGQKGSARIYGKSTMLLGMKVLRKPFIALKQLIGF